MAKNTKEETAKSVNVNSRWAVYKDKWDMANLLNLKYEQCELVYSMLKPPAVDALSGEYHGYNPFYVHVRRGQMENNPFVTVDFLGKAFRRNPLGNGMEGDGYIIWRADGAIVRNAPFGWYIGPSVIDGKDALCMTWKAFDDPESKEYGYDEVREAAPGLYLCITVNPLSRPDEPVAGRPNYWIIGDKAGEWVGPDHEFPLSNYSVEKKSE